MRDPNGPMTAASPKPSPPRLANLILTALFLALFANAGVVRCEPSAPNGGFVSVSGDRFVDAKGRQVILHGLNVVDKTADWSANPWLDERSFAAMRGWGFDCIRLAFTWASLEPQPGVYSEKCLAELDKRVEWARRNGLYVFLDMHQDLYSIRFSDGAPEWATLTDGKPHTAEGAVWSDAYLTSPAVQTALDNFFSNKPGPGGVGLQERYASAWRHVAEHFAHNPTVIGYDLMNEPFAGSLVPQTMAAMSGKLAEELNAKPGAAPLDADAVMGLWGQPEGRTRLLKMLEDPARYGRVLDAAQPVVQEFERTVLTGLFQRVTDSIRKVDSNHIIFLETSGSSNMGVYSSIEPMKDASGRRDPRQAYAPHGYDLVTDTAEAAAASSSRLGLIFSRHGETARRLAMPMLVGEWGAYYGNPNARPTAEFICRQFERLLCGDTYWAIEKDLAEQPAFGAFCRPYPLCVPGRILSYSADSRKRSFSCTWKEDPGATEASRIYLPGSYGPDKSRIRLTPVGKGCTLEAAQRDSTGVFINIAPLGAAGAGERTLTFN